MKENINVYADKGIVYKKETPIQLSEISWDANKSFKGVFMKTLISGTDTCGLMSCHLVRIEAGMEIGKHIHAGKIELHEVIGGEGVAFNGESKMDYRKGTIALIPADIEHRVIAGEEGLFLFAKFCPALE